MARKDYDDLHGIDLSRLNLDHIDLDIEEKPSRAWRWVALVALLIMGGAILWFPSSEYYHALGQRNWVFFVVAGVAAVVGVLGGRWLWRWAEESAAEWAREQERYGQKPEEEKGPPSALRRWLTLLAVVGGGAGILFGLPAMGYLQSGQDISNVWFAAAAGAVVVGILLGRWMLMQAEAKPAEPKERIPIEMPPWFKWVVLAGLIAAGAAALLIPSFYDGSELETVRFALGGVGLFVGIIGAIWLAARFDETEKKLREKAERQRGGR